MAILSVQNLTTQILIEKKSFAVVDNLSFDLHAGKTLAIVGESGCGKSMTALSILRALPSPPVLFPQGKIIYQDMDLLSLSEHKMREIRGAKISMIFQDPSSALNPVYTIKDQLTEVAELHLNLFGDEANQLALKSLNEVGIPSPERCLFSYPHQLSGGMKQRVMIAMALMCEPDILIADEPTTALDVTIQAQILDLMKNLQKRKGMAILLITHDMGVVAEMADEILVMYASQKIETGQSLDIFDAMGHPYTIGLFHSRPNQWKGNKLTPIKGVVPPLTQYPPGCRFHPRCPYVMEKCKNHPIPDFKVESNAVHQAKCLLWDETLESEEQKINKDFYNQRKT